MAIVELDDFDPRELRLDPVGRRHVAALEALAAAPELVAELPADLGRGRARAWVDRVRAAAAAGLEHRFAVMGRSRLMGLVGLVEVGPDEAHLVYAVDPRGWGQGLGTAAARLTLGFAFRRLGLRRVRARVRAENARSRAVLARVGFSPAPAAGGGDGPLHYVLPASDWTGR